jgi:hypothetical protein
MTRPIQLGAARGCLLGAVLCLGVEAAMAQTCTPLQTDGRTPCISVLKWNEEFNVSGAYVRVRFRNDCNRAITVNLVRQDGPDTAVVPKNGIGGSHCAKPTCVGFVSWEAQCTGADRARQPPRSSPSPTPAPTVAAPPPSRPQTSAAPQPPPSPAPQVAHPRPAPTSVERCRNRLHEVPFPTIHDCSDSRYGPVNSRLRREWQKLCSQLDDDVTRYCEMKRDGLNTQPALDRARTRWQEMERIMRADSAPPPQRGPASAPAAPSAKNTARYVIPSDLRTNCQNRGLYLVRGTRAHNVNCVPPERARAFCEGSLHGRYVTENGDRLCLDQ